MPICVTVMPQKTIFFRIDVDWEGYPRLKLHGSIHFHVGMGRWNKI